MSSSQKKVSDSFSQMNELLNRLLFIPSSIIVVGIIAFVVDLLVFEGTGAISKFFNLAFSSLYYHAFYYVMIYVPYLIMELFTNFSTSWWFRSTERFFLYLNPLVLYLFTISFIGSIGIVPMYMLYSDFKQ